MKKLMFDTIKDSGKKMKIKASGGVRDMSQITQFKPYVDRFGMGYGSVDKLNNLTYLKLFEDYNDEYYQEITDPLSYNSSVKTVMEFDRKLEKFDEKEIEKIKSYLPNIKIEKEYGSNLLMSWHVPDENINDIENEFILTIHNIKQKWPMLVGYYDDNKELEIFKLDDEWFIVRVPTSQVVEELFRKIVIYKAYKCDQIEGIKYIMNLKFN